MKKQFALNYLMSQMWALDQSMLSTMGNIATRAVSADELKDLFAEKQAVEGKSGKFMTRNMELREGGVGVIHVRGVISRYASIFEDICGGTSTETIAKELTQAVENPAIKGVVINYGTPGGNADGINELGNMIREYSAKKPIISYVGGLAASAGYWLATCGSELVIDATAELGSIGTVMTFMRMKQSDDVETIEIVSSQSPNKRLDPATKEGRAAYQVRLDELADIFVDSTAKNMGVDREKVLNDFGRGGLIMGQKAVDIGMATRLGSLEGVIAELRNGKSNRMDPKNKSADGGNQGVTMTLPNAESLSATDFIAQLNQQRPDVVAAMQPEAPEMAIAAAADIAKQCTDAGMPALSASLLQNGITKADAEQQIKTASALKDTLSASGLTASFDALLPHIGDPAALAGKAIHEAQAASDESSDSNRQTTGETEQKTAVVDSKSIYKKRNSKR